MLSLVLVVEDEQPNLRELADLLLTDVELVVVADAVPEPPDPRVRVLQAPAGDARALALDAVAGEHVWFLEPGDRPAPGALGAITRQLALDAPDVLLVGPAQRRLLARLAELGPGPLDQRPRAADAAPRLANKVLRTALVRESARFDAGELGVTWPALLAAERIAAAPGPVLIRRRGPAPAAGLDLLAQYDTVLAIADVPAERRRLVLPAMRRHALSLLPRVPRGERREFFRRLSQIVRRHRTGDEPRPAGRLERVRAGLVEHDRYAAFRLVEAGLRATRAAGRRRAALDRRRRRIAADAREARLERYYRARLREPIDPQLAVFAAYWYRGYACNPRAIYEEARRLVPGMRGVWVVKPGAVASFPPGVEHVVAGTREYFDVLARAAYLVNNVNFPNHLVKREGSVHVATHHGTPLKRMGLDLRDHPVTGLRMDFDALLRRCRRWDYSISSNAFSTAIWERVYPAQYESLETGYPRNDALATATDADVRRVRAELGIEPGQVAVLYAPTHREYEPTYVPVLDVAAVAEALGPDHVVLARLHYFYDADPRLRELHRQGRVRDVAAHPSVEELCVAADVLVTDYSSIMFDYAVLDRPIVVHAPDWEVYRAVRGTYFDLMAEPPGVTCRTEAELVDALRSRTAWGDEARAARAAFRERFCSLEDGHAAERVVRRVWLGEREAARPGAAPLAR
jgi:CDP-glycerol glycerophosphotransferase